MKEFNVNHNVKVKLTQIGIDELKRQHDDLAWCFPSMKNECFVPPKVDENGYSTFQMHVLMSTFGHLCQNGFSVPFETTILIDI